MSSSRFLSGKPFLDPRTIRITPKPFPIHLTERRAILQVLGQHGRLESFRQDIDKPGSFVAIVRDVNGVEELKRRSPLSLQIRKPRKTPHISPIPKQASSHGIARNNDTANQRGPSNDSGEDSKQFTVYIYPEPDFDHLEASYKNTSSQPWTKGDMVYPSFATTALHAQLPKDMAHDGLAQWNFDASSDRQSLMGAAERRMLRNLLPSKMGDPGTPKKPAIKARERDSEKVDRADDPFVDRFKARV